MKHQLIELIGIKKILILLLQAHHKIDGKFKLSNYHFNSYIFKFKNNKLEIIRIIKTKSKVYGVKWDPFEE